jgi:uncharacterized protein YraI
MKTFTKTIAVFLFLMGSAGLVSAQSTFKVKSSTGANLRQGPATGKEVITTMPAGAKVKVVEKASDGWYKVEYDGKSGYVSSALIEEDSNPNNANNASNSSGSTNNTASNSRSNNDSPAAEKKTTSNSTSSNNANNATKKSSNNKSKSNSGSASSAAYKWGIGLRLGEPAGLTVKKYNSNNTAWEINLGRAARWGHHYGKDDFYKYSRYSNTNNYYYSGFVPGFTTALQVRYMWSKPINGADGLSFYYGGGLQARFTPVKYRYYYYDGNDTDWWKDNRYYREDRVTDIDLGLDGVLGLEYMMKDLPLSFFLDMNLFVEIVDTPFIIYPQGGAGVRYNF